MSQQNNLKYKKLRDKWYLKLKKSGFVDIEDVNSPKEMLLSWDSYRFIKSSSKESKHNKWFVDEGGSVTLKHKAIETYFQNAAWFLENHIFDTSLDKRAWKLHADGFSLQEIAKKLDIKKSRAFVIIKKLKEALNGRKG